MDKPFRRTWAEIDLDAILFNYKTVKSHTNAKVMAVVKADAYGHGDVAVARVLSDAQADWFAVSNYEEALHLRENGITRPILILGYTPPDYAERLASNEITQAVYSLEYARALNLAALEANVTVDCHIKLDTGMSRIGFNVQKGQEASGAAEVASSCALPGLQCTGIFTHFACADECTQESDAFTLIQYNAFMTTITLLSQQGIHFLLRHCCNSAATLRFPQMHLDMVRAGIILYGLTPSLECAELVDLHPAMRFYSTVTLVKEVVPGTQISYGRTYTAPDTRRLATVAVGYADGFRRSFSNRGRVIVRGQYAPIVGRICMDQMLVDVTHIPEAQMGDVVTLVGGVDKIQITFDDFASLNATINYEETCLLGRRVPRIYHKDGREAGFVDYLLQDSIRTVFT